MTQRVIRVGVGAGDTLREGIARIQSEQHLQPEFPAEVIAAAQAAAARPGRPEKDRTDLPLVTLDPDGSLDLDQAMHLARDGDGYVVHYAIADLPAFVTPGDAVDAEAHRRGETLYGADSTIPLHPTVLSEGAASLLPGELRPAYVWTIRLDAEGGIVDGTVERARVTSRSRLSYDGGQADLDAGRADPMMLLLQEIGELRVAQERRRGGVNLPMPEQEIDIVGDRWTLAFRTMRPVETWNAQISLLTGIVAADLMIRGRVGVLRTLPPPEQQTVDRLRHTAKALGVPWPADEGYAELVHGLDPTDPRDAAMTLACTGLLRGAGYTPFDGEVPAQTQHAALATEYAHVTAPLRRLVDRYGLEACAALCAGEEVPAWVREALPGLPATMQESGHRASAYEHAVLDLVEASLLQGSVGQQFPAVVLEADRRDPTKGTVQVADPAVEAKVHATVDVPVGESVTVTLAEADPATRTVLFSLPPP